MSSEARSGDAAGRMRRALLAKALLFEPDDVACRACLSRLDDYVAGQLARHNYREDWTDVAAHLDACIDCAETYRRLYDLEVSATAERLPQPVSVPAPDLGFLRRQAVATSDPSQAKAFGPVLTARLRAALSRAGNRLRFEFSPDLLQLLSPMPAHATATARAGAERYREVLLTMEPDEALRRELPIAVTAYRDAHRPELCLVEITVEPAHRSWPDLGNTAVGLVVAGERHEAATDAWGLACFEDIPISLLAATAIDVTLPTD